MLLEQDALELRRKYLAENRAVRKLFTRIAASAIMLFAIILGLAVVSAPDVKDDGTRSVANAGNPMQASVSLDRQHRSAPVNSGDNAGR